MAFSGRFEPADVMVLFVMVLPSLPEVVPVEKNKVPDVVVVLEPCMVQY